MLVVGAKDNMYGVPSVSEKILGMSRITRTARQLKLPEEKLLGDWIVCIPGFTLNKYRKLQRSRLSIFSLHCFGGLLSHLLGLPFRSPFVNLFLDESDFVKLLRAPRVYMEERLIFKGKEYNEPDKFYYPVYTLGNVDLHMNHYPDFEEAVTKWNERKTRINWYNLFVTAYTEDAKVLEAFDELPYGKKVCFVPFKSDLDSAWHINPEIGKHLKEFKRIVNYFAMRQPFYYDLFDMLLYGKKTQLIDM